MSAIFQLSVYHEKYCTDKPVLRGHL